jgi:AAA15 family ATPase/GTPase
MAFTSKDSLIKALKEQLATRENQAIKGLLTIYSFQTNEEKCEGYTKEFNGMGFLQLIQISFLVLLNNTLQKVGFLLNR